MSNHDTHHPVQETKGIWALPLTVVILAVIAVFIFTCDCKTKTATEGHQEKTEAHH
jgi:hypothetical protein